MNELTKIVVSIVIREWSQSLDHNLYYQLLLVSKFTNATVNYLLSPQRAKHRFRIQTSEEINDGTHHYYIMPNGKRTGISREMILGIPHENFYLDGEIVFRYRVYEPGANSFYHYRHNGSKTISQNTYTKNQQHITHTIISIWSNDITVTYWTKRSLWMSALGAQLINNQVDIEETPMANHYRLKMDISNDVVVKFSYANSQFYSILKDIKFQQRMVKASKNVFSGKFQITMKKIASERGWEFLSYKHG